MVAAADATAYLASVYDNTCGKDTAPLLDITFHQTEGQDVVRISVKPSPKPVFVRDAQGEHLCIRAGNSTRHLTTREALDC